MFPTFLSLHPRVCRSVWLLWELEMKVITAIFWSLKSLWLWLRVSELGSLIKLFVDCKLYLWHLADNDKYLRPLVQPTHSSLYLQRSTFKDLWRKMQPEMTDFKSKNARKHLCECDVCECVTIYRVLCWVWCKECDCRWYLSPYSICLPISAYSPCFTSILSVKYLKRRPSKHTRTHTQLWHLYILRLSANKLIMFVWWLQECQATGNI